MKIQETVYELLNQQYELARIQEAKEIPTRQHRRPSQPAREEVVPHQTTRHLR